MKMTFAEAAKQYIENQELEDGRGIPAKQKKLDQRMIPYFGEMEFSAINRFDVERFKRHLLEEGLSHGTVNRYLAVLSHMFNKGVEWEWLVKVPCKIVRYREDNRRTTYLSAEEIGRLLEAARADSSPVIEPFIRIALGTAMRKGEIMSIRIENIDCANREIYIPKAKCGARTQPMTRGLAAYLEQYLLEHTTPGQVWLFPSPKSTTGHRVEIEKPFWRVLEAAGLDRWQVCRHTLRHTAITHLVQTGVDLPTVQRFSGHRSIHMVFRYSHQSKAHIHNALDKLEGQMLS